MSQSSSNTSSPDACAAAILVAGGAGRRMGAGEPKQFRLLGGTPVLQRALDAFLGHPAVGEIIVVLPAGDAGAPPSWLSEAGVLIVAGGERREDSVWHGLRALRSELPVVLIHDGVRPLVSRDLIARVAAAVNDAGIVPVLPVADTIKRVDPDGVVVATPDRAALRRAQTPQGFPLAALRTAYQQARSQGSTFTDDAALFAAFGGRVRTVAGEMTNLKITNPADVIVAEALSHHPAG